MALIPVSLSLSLSLSFLSPSQSAPVPDICHVTVHVPVPVPVPVRHENLSYLTQAYLVQAPCLYRCSDRAVQEYLAQAYLAQVCLRKSKHTEYIHSIGCEPAYPRYCTAGISNQGFQSSTRKSATLRRKSKGNDFGRIFSVLSAAAKRSHAFGEYGRPP